MIQIISKLTQFEFRAQEPFETVLGFFHIFRLKLISVHLFEISNCSFDFISRYFTRTKAECNVLFIKLKRLKLILHDNNIFHRRCTPYEMLRFVTEPCYLPFKLLSVLKFSRLFYFTFYKLETRTELL